MGNMQNGMPMNQIFVHHHQTTTALWTFQHFPVNGNFPFTRQINCAYIFHYLLMVVEVRWERRWHACLRMLTGSQARKANELGIKLHVF